MIATCFTSSYMADSYFGLKLKIPEIKHGSREKKNGEMGIENYYTYTLKLKKNFYVWTVL
jgi:hypothetical protein